MNKLGPKRLKRRRFFVTCLFIYILQMTGLDIEKDQIIEMACLITDSDLNILAEVGEVGNTFIPLKGHWGSKSAFF